MTATTTKTPTAPRPLPEGMQRRATRTSFGAAVSASPQMHAPAFLVGDPRAPRPVREAFEALDQATADGRALFAAVRDASAARRALDDEQRRAHARGEDGPSPEEFDTADAEKAKAEGRLSMHIRAAWLLACEAEFLVRVEHARDLRALAARIAVEQDRRATQALGDFDAAVDAREAAYAFMGRPVLKDDPERYWQQVPRLPSRLSLARQDVRDLAALFPRRSVASLAATFTTEEA